MNELPRFEALAARARKEMPPQVHVVAGVLCDIGRGVFPQAWTRPLLVGSGLSALAASIMLLLAVEAWASLADPLLNLFDTLTLVMQ